MPKGRPRTNGPREPNGRLRRSRRDYGTLQAQAKRLLLVPDGDQAKASCPLDVLHAAAVISHDQHRAGLRYAWLHAIAFGRGHLRGAARYEMSYAESRSEPDDAEWLERRSAELNGVLQALAGQPAYLKANLEDVAVYERLPEWAGPCLPTHAHVTEARRLLRALSLLVDHMGKCN